MTLLPPNASLLERALEGATARLGSVPIASAATLWNPATCPAELLPWLAWALSVDSWDASWPDTTKRGVVAGAIAAHRRKGTRAAVDQLLARLDAFAEVVEWWQATPPAAPHTFEVHLPFTGVPPGGDRASAAFADRVLAEIAKVKPLREHVTLVQTLTVSGAIGVQAVARAVAFARTPVDLTADTSPAWAPLLQTEDGEPVSDDTLQFLDTTP